MTKEEAYKRRQALASAMKSIAQALGENAPVTKAMGPLAWGRYEGEPSGSDSKDNAVFGYGFLCGVRHALLFAARENGWKGERLLANALAEARKIEGN